MTRKEFEKTIGGVIRKLRLRKKLTPEQAAELCGCSLKQWHIYESKGSNSIRPLLKIAISLDGYLTPLTACLAEAFSTDILKSISLKGAYTPMKRNMNLQEILSFLEKENRPWVKEKLQALAWLAEGMKVKAVGKRLGKSQGLVQQWLSRYNKSGIGWVLVSSKPRNFGMLHLISTKGK